MARVSVLISTYNGERYLGQAVRSILNQTLSDFELIIVNDGSKDSSESVIKSFPDPRIVYICNSQNQGIAVAQNKGLSVARGEYVALQDHDDISLPDRLRLQVNYLDSHPDIAMVGSSSIRIDELGSFVAERRAPLKDIDLKWHLMFGHPFVHTSLMIRRGVLEFIGGYSQDPQLRICEDYDFTSRIATRYSVANFADPLVHWREHSGSATLRFVREQNEGGRTIALRNIRQVLSQNEVDVDGLESMRMLFTSQAKTVIQLSSDEVRKGLIFQKHLQTCFYKKYGFSSSVVRAHRRWFGWTYGKHLLALAYRYNGKRILDFRFRLTLLKLGATLLFGNLSSYRVNCRLLFQPSKPAS